MSDSEEKKTRLSGRLIEYLVLGFAIVAFVYGLVESYVGDFSDALGDLGVGFALLIVWYLGRKQQRKGKS
jgi:hypothetical protein